LTNENASYEDLEFGELASILVVVLSQNWLASLRCRREFDVFVQRWGIEGDEGIKQRIIVIRRGFVAVDQLPSLLRSLADDPFASVGSLRGEVFTRGDIRALIGRLATHLDRLIQHMAYVAPSVGRGAKHPNQLTLQELLAKRKATRAAGMPTTTKVKSSIGGSNRSFVFINAAQEDQPHALELKRQFSDRMITSVLPVSLNDEGSHPTEPLKYLTRNIVECDALVTVLGDATTIWLNTMMAQYRKLMPQRAEPPKANILALTSMRMNDVAEGYGRDVHVVPIDQAVPAVEAALAVSDARPRSLSAAAVLPDQGDARNRTGAGVEVVEVSAFSPRSARPADQVLVQVFLHCPDDRTAAKVFAEDADSQTTARGIATLATELVRGQRIGVVLEAPDLSVDQSTQYIIWRGDPRACQFLVSIPPNALGPYYQLQVRILIESAPIGFLRFTLKLTTAEEEADSEMEMRGDYAKRYRYAFLSYASSDRAEVVKRAMMLKAVGVHFFLDLLNLDPGQRWEQRLYREIDRCDVFFLFWSSNAARSDWVVREAEYALRRYDASMERAPDIRPIIIEGPPVSPPPDSLNKIHFNDPMCYVLAGVEAESRRSR
jgi:hypothetical protein